MLDKNSEVVGSENETPQGVDEKVTVTQSIVNEQVVQPVNKIPEPLAEFIEYTGEDSSSVTEISSMEILDDEEREAVKTWIGQIRKPRKGQKLPTEQIISEGVKLIRELSADANRLINEANKNFADRAIAIGQICIKLKELIRGSGKPWDAWAEENLPFIAQRNRQKYMMIANRPDCWPFSFLGVDRLEMLCSVTRDMKGKERIGDLFKKYKIPFDDTTEVNMAEFKAMIDAAINNERLEKNGLNIEFKLVTNMLSIGVDFDKSMIKRLKDIQNCGGKPETLLQKISLAGGKEDIQVTPEKRLQDFNNLTNRLIKTLDFIMGDQDQLVKIDRETFRMLIEKLICIQDMGILKEDEEKAV